MPIKTSEKQTMTSTEKREMLITTSHTRTRKNAVGILTKALIESDSSMGNAIMNRSNLVSAYKSHAKEWSKIKNAGKIKILQGEYYSGYSLEYLIREDFLTFAELWISGLDCECAMRNAKTSREETLPRLNYFDNYFANL